MRRTALVLIGIALVASVAADYELPQAGAGALLHPARRTRVGPTPSACIDTVFRGDDVALTGWRCAAAGTARATIVYLHGIADNHASASGVVARFVPKGFDVIAYDSRANGASGGDACTYGYFEKEDLRRVLDTVVHPPIVLIGTSLGAAVALQEAATDARVRAIVAAETFSDLRTVVTERAPWFFSKSAIQRSFQLAEMQANFRVDDVSPARAAAHIRVPVLLIHGAADTDTRPAHSERVLAALQGDKQLILVPGAAHNQSLSGHTWASVEQWISATLAN